MINTFRDLVEMETACKNRWLIVSGRIRILENNQKKGIEMKATISERKDLPQ